MDAALLHSYRLIWADITMLWDAASIYYARRPAEGYTLSGFAAGLSLLMKSESEIDASDTIHNEDVVDFTEGLTFMPMCLHSTDLFDVSQTQQRYANLCGNLPTEVIRRKI